MEKPWYQLADWWVAIFTFGLLGVTAVLARYTYSLWKDGAEASRIAFDDFLASHRPWIKCTVALAEHPQFFGSHGLDHEGLHLLIRTTLKNFGTSPAVGLRSFWTLRATENDLSALQKKLLAQFTPANMDAHSLFPGEEVTSTTELTMTKSELNEAIAKGVEISPESTAVTIDLIGLTRYTSGDTRTAHQTGCGYQLATVQLRSGGYLTRPAFVVRKDGQSEGNAHLLYGPREGLNFAT